MAVGFIHGVMNTDNMTISGETIDYGPCAFLDGYDPATVFSSIDERGRYAYGNQPRIARGTWRASPRRSCRSRRGRRGPSRFATERWSASRPSSTQPHRV